ncbi:MAG: hypothetical protein U0794_04210 [Isosphaeraceae bacterium]
MNGVNAGAGPEPDAIAWPQQAIASHFFHPERGRVNARIKIGRGPVRARTCRCAPCHGVSLGFVRDVIPEGRGAVFINMVVDHSKTLAHLRPVDDVRHNASCME